MKSEIIKIDSVIKKRILVAGIILLVFIIYYSFMNMLSSSRKMKEIENEFKIIPDETNAIDERIQTDSLYLKLLKERAFLQSKITMAGTDSNYLIINLKDSIANIEISGVVVHIVKISNIRTSKILLNGNENIIFSMLSSPLRILSEISTIEKEPVMIKMAPKDTSEYIPDIMPDTSYIEPVNYILETTNGIRIYVYQEEKNILSERINIIIFDTKERFRDFWSSLKKVVLVKVPEYHPFIKIRIPRADAKIIYRAIPRDGLVGVYL